MRCLSDLIPLILAFILLLYLKLLLSQPFHQHLKPRILHGCHNSHPSLPPMNQPPSVPTVLNQNGIATNVESTRGKRKRAPAGSRTGASNKRPRQTASATLESSTPSASCGVGPTSNAQSHRGDVENHDPNHPVAPSMPPTISTQQSTSKAPPLRRYQDHPAAATDVWYFLHALETAEEPVVKPKDEPILECKPSTPYVGCKLCM
ncbi:hypothetical protein BJ912DRAFT_923236 [Pholiota molesta]|nr:hypothetical protein BJ912DRAFT_923236 [Pholiota molesta]